MSEPRIFGNLFLSIGAMKAGTTWLYAVLNRHPELHFAMEKEIHYFYHRFVNKKVLSEERRLHGVRSEYLLRFNPTRGQIDKIRTNLRWVAAYLDEPVDDFWYRNLFQLRRNETFACDFSNLHALLPDGVWPRISERCDTLRVLYTMRDPIQRLWSHAKFELQFTGKLDNLQTWGPDDFAAFVRQKHIWDNAEYGSVLRNLRTGLSPEQYKVLFYEDLHSDQRASLRSIEEFLGVKPFNYPEAILTKRFTESVKHPMPEFFPGLFADELARIYEEVQLEGFDIPASWSALPSARG